MPTPLGEPLAKDFSMRILALAIATAFVSTAAFSTPIELVTNGGFETTTNGLGQFSNNTMVPGWTSSGYNFVFDGANPSAAVRGQFGGLALWGPGNGSNNGLTGSPAGGNFVGADGAFEVGAITQKLSGLTAGHKYDVSFYWGGAQQDGFNGITTEQWIVSLGGISQSTAVLTNANHGFTGWQKTSFTFTAQTANDVLSFLAVGTPNGEPPFSVLDGVSATAVAPVAEPGALAIFGFGGLGLAAVARRRK